jgi:hypothetical protein
MNVVIETLDVYFYKDLVNLIMTFTSFTDFFPEERERCLHELRLLSQQSTIHPSGHANFSRIAPVTLVIDMSGSFTVEYDDTLPMIDVFLTEVLNDFLHSDDSLYTIVSEILFQPREIPNPLGFGFSDGYTYGLSHVNLAGSISDTRDVIRKFLTKCHDSFYSSATGSSGSGSQKTASKFSSYTMLRL